MATGGAERALLSVAPSLRSKEWHPFPDIDDAEKTKLWKAAGYEVRRMMANDVYH